MTKEPMNFMTAHRYMKDGAVLVLLCAFVILCWLPRLKGPIDLRWDGGAYYILGSSLAQGKGYRLLNEPGDMQTTLHSPLLPIIVAVHQRLLGTSDPTIVGHQLRLSFFFLSIIYIAAVYAMLRMYLPLQLSFLGSLICLLHRMTQFMSDLLFAEIPFGLATVLFVTFQRMSGSSRVCHIAAPFCAVAAYALRTIGVTLLIAYVGESLLNRKFKMAAARLALSLVPILCWQSYTRHVESGPEYARPAYEYQRAHYMYTNVTYVKNIFSYKDPFSPEMGPASVTNIARRALRNMITMPINLGEAVSIERSVISSWNRLGLLLLLGVLVMTGGVVQLASRHWLVPLYVLLYLAVMCLTPWPSQFSRYLMPLIPFLVLFLFESIRGIGALSQRVSTTRWRSAGILFGGAVICLIFVLQMTTIVWLYRVGHHRVAYTDINGRSVEHGLFFYGTYKNFDGVLDWLRSQASRGDVVAGPDPHWVYLRTGLKSVFPPFETDVDKAQHLLDSVPVKYLIVHKWGADTVKYTLPLVKRHPDQWRLVYSVALTGVVSDIYERVGL